MKANDRSPGQPPLHSFLSSLVQLTTTILGILLAALSAYYVFLQDRTAQFEDQIQANKREIRDSLRSLPASWPQGLAMYLPSEFREEYRKEYPGKGGADFVEQAAIDVLFLNAPIKQAMERVRAKDHFGGPWYGRAYFWVLDEAVGSLTLASRHTESSPEAVFPWSADGPGFEQWRHEFRKVRGALTLLGDYQPEMLLDFQQFVLGLPPEYKAMNLATHFQASAAMFFEQVKVISSKLDKIDEHELSAKRYSFERKVQLNTILVLCALAIGAGVLVPQTLLAQGDVSATFGRILFLVSIICLGGASRQFAQDIARPVTIDWSSYIAARWYEPILRQVQHQKSGFENGGMINAEYCMDAVHSEGNAHFAREVLEAIKLYVEQVEVHNKAANDFNLLALERMREDKVIQGASANVKSLRGRATFYPYYLIDDRKWNEFRDASIRQAEGDVFVEVLGPSWSRIEFQIPGHLFTQNSSRLLKALEEIRNSVRSEPEAREFMKVRESMGKTSDHLIEVLGRLTTRKS